MGIHGQSVDESDYDVLNVDILLELSTRLKEGIECLKVKFIWKHLESEREREKERERELQDITSRYREENNEKSIRDIYTISISDHRQL